MPGMNGFDLAQRIKGNLSKIADRPGNGVCRIAS